MTGKTFNLTSVYGQTEERSRKWAGEEDGQVVIANIAAFLYESMNIKYSQSSIIPAACWETLSNWTETADIPKAHFSMSANLAH